jgi:hypothetical protein
MEDQLVVDGDTVGLWRQGRRLAVFDLAAVTRVVIVRAASAIFHGDEPFVVVEAPPNLLVLPFLAAGSRELLSTLAQRDGQAQLWEAECEGLPMRWRRRLLGALPLFPVPRTAVHPMQTKPDWREYGPRPLADLRALTGATAP